jgi:pimeloyl-ACP methyl ester carboxylesterase
VFTNEARHHLDAGRILHDLDRQTARAKEIFIAAKCLIPVDDDVPDAVQGEDRTGTHRVIGMTVTMRMGTMMAGGMMGWGARLPLKYARNVKTPTLILHSDMDFRVPIEQGQQWFRALQHFGVPSEVVFFPRENHNLTRTGEPKHLVESLNWQVYWFDRYLNGNASAIPPDAPAVTSKGSAQAN